MHLDERVGEISGVRLTRPERHEDERGWFMEILREDALGVRFVQANHSHSQQGVLRGLHFHARQADAWYLLSGRARVGLADLRERKDPPAAATVDLSADDPAVLYIPPGVAHGFLALTEIDLVYFVTEYYDASDEFGVAWNDQALGVAWEVSDPILSERDQMAPPLDWEDVERALLGSVDED